jgi:hypothetical protein
VPATGENKNLEKKMTTPAQIRPIVCGTNTGFSLIEMVKTLVNQKLWTRKEPVALQDSGTVYYTNKKENAIKLYYLWGNDKLYSLIPVFSHVDQYWMAKSDALPEYAWLSQVRFTQNPGTIYLTVRMVTRRYRLNIVCNINQYYSFCFPDPQRRLQVEGSAKLNEHIKTLSDLVRIEKITYFFIVFCCCF